MNCLMHQWRLSRSLDQQEEPTKKDRAHLERCDACRNFYEVNREVHRTEPAKVSPQLHAKIMHGVATTNREPAPGPIPVWAGAIAGLMILIGVSAFHLFTPAPEPVETAAVFTDVESLTEVVSTPLGELAEGPEAEFERIKSDIRSVTEFFMTQL